MINHLKYAKSMYSRWIMLFATILGIISIIQMNNCISIAIVITCFILPFIIPFVSSIYRCSFDLRTQGKTKVNLSFGDLFDEECLVITTNNYFDIIPTGEHISEESLIGGFVKKYLPNNSIELENDLKSELQRDDKGNIIPAEYGHYIKKTIAGKLIYFLVFTDRQKNNQPDDFYIKTLQTFFRSIVNENHGKAIALPLIGNNNNLSDSGFSNSEMTFLNMMAMINCFEITNLRSELKLRIIALPEERSKLIKVIPLFL